MSNENPQYPQQPQAPYGGYNQPKDSSLAIISMIFGIAAYLVLPVVGAIVAIICGHIAKSQVNSNRGMIKGGGMATAGLILGYIQIGLLVIAIAVVIIIAAAASSNYY